MKARFGENFGHKGALLCQRTQRTVSKGSVRWGQQGDRTSGSGQASLGARGNLWQREEQNSSSVGPGWEYSPYCPGWANRAEIGKEEDHVLLSAIRRHCLTRSSHIQLPSFAHSLLNSKDRASFSFPQRDIRSFV